MQLALSQNLFMSELSFTARCFIAAIFLLIPGKPRVLLRTADLLTTLGGEEGVLPLPLQLTH